MTRMRPPTLAELAAMIRVAPPGVEQDRLVRLYWAKAVEVHGFKKAAWYRAEYEWLRRDSGKDEARWAS